MADAQIVVDDHDSRRALARSGPESRLTPRALEILKDLRRRRDIAHDLLRPSVERATDAHAAFRNAETQFAELQRAFAAGGVARRENLPTPYMDRSHDGGRSTATQAYRIRPDNERLEREKKSWTPSGLNCATSCTSVKSAANSGRPSREPTPTPWIGYPTSHDAL